MIFFPDTVKLVSGLSLKQSIQISKLYVCKFDLKKKINEWNELKKIKFLKLGGHCLQVH